MAVTVDAQTWAEHQALTLASARATLIRDALTSPVTFEVYRATPSGPQLMGSGTMQDPWCSASGATITLGQLNASLLTVAVAGVPDGQWYCQFKGANGRYVRGGFGLAGSTADFKWSGSAFVVGGKGRLASGQMLAVSGAADPQSSVSTYFDSLYAPTFTLNSATDAKTQPAQTKPAKSTNILTGGYTDQVFGTAIRRVTAVGDVTAAAVPYLRHEYSRRQAWNADNTLFLAQSSNGFWWLYDANTLQIIPGGNTNNGGVGAIAGLGGDCEPIWHPTDPLKIWHTAGFGGLVWYERTVARTAHTSTATVLFDMGPKMAALGAPWNTAVAVWFNGEGRPSNDGRWWGMSVEAPLGVNDRLSIGFLMYDRLTDTITGKILTQGNRPNWVGTTPLGNWVVASWYAFGANGALGSLAEEAARPITQRTGVWAYSRDFTQVKVLSVLGEHSDFAVDAQGRECYVWISYRGSAEGGLDGILCRQIAEDNVFNLITSPYVGAGNAYHISGCASDRPGWVVLGRYVGVGANPYDGQVHVAELKPNPRIYRLAHTRVSLYDYFAEPHPTPNRDLTRVMFASDFGQGTTPYEDFCICLPSWAIPAAT